MSDPVAIIRAAAPIRAALGRYARWASRHEALARRHVPSSGPLTHAQAVDIVQRAADAELRHPDTPEYPAPEDAA